MYLAKYYKEIGEKEKAMEYINGLLELSGAYREEGQALIKDLSGN